MINNSKGLKRRTVLRNISISAVGGGFLSKDLINLNNYDSENLLEDKYKSIDHIRAALEENTEALLRKLFDRNLINTTDIDGLSVFIRYEKYNVSELFVHRNNRDIPEDIVVMSTFDEQTETKTSVIRVMEEFENRKVKIYALPEANRSYAIVTHDSSEKEIIYPDSKGPEIGSTEISTEDNCSFSHYDHECTDDVCNSGVDICSPFPGVWVECDWEHYLMEEYAVYCCDNIEEKSEGGTEGGTCWQELEHKYCTNECCSEQGEGCSASGCGCSA